MEKRQKKLLLTVVAILMTGIVLCGGLLLWESTVLHPEEEVLHAPSSKTIVRDGVGYFPRQDITVILVMGIDEKGPVKDSLSYNNRGEADMVALVILDEKEESCKILTLNRDAMVPMPMLGLGGKYAGTKVAQLALSHTYGSGLEDSCENTRQTVSDFLGGIQIDYYISMNMDAVAILNDAVGGVTVTVTEDFSRVDPSIPQGSVTLRGDQALTYVQARRNVGDERNQSRIERQKGYMQSFAQAFSRTVSQGEGNVLTVYESVAPYLVSDLPVSTLSSMVERYQDYSLAEPRSLEGENRLGEEYYEFYPHEEKLKALILELFYAPK